MIANTRLRPSDGCWISFTGGTARGIVTSADDLALDGPDGLSETVDPCADLARKLLFALLPNAISLFPASGILLLQRRKPSRTAQEKRTENGGRGEGRGCEQGVEIGTKSEAVLFSGETGWRACAVLGINAITERVR